MLCHHHCVMTGMTTLHIQNHKQTEHDNLSSPLRQNEVIAQLLYKCSGRAHKHDEQNTTNQDRAGLFFFL